MRPKPAKPDDWFLPLPGIERDENHAYWLGDFRFSTSVTGVLSASKSDYALQQIEATRATWEARGVNVHYALEMALTRPDWTPDLSPETWDYLDWITPLLDHAIWSEVEIIASEYKLYALDHLGGLSIAGTFDLAWQIPDTVSPLHGGPERVLADLKSLSPSGRTYSVRAQLGGYLTLAAHHGIVFDRCAVLWAWPKRCKLVTYSTEECLEAWESALSTYHLADTSRMETGAD